MEPLFARAEAMQKEAQPQYPYFYSLWGFRYCDLLLGLGRTREVLERATKTLEWVTKAGWLLDIALDKLSLGRAFLLQAVANRGKGSQQAQTGTDPDFAQARQYLDAAVSGLREAGHHEFIARGLLARAEYFREKGEWEKARQDLAEVEEIARRGGMKLHLVDYHLEQARLYQAQSNQEEADKHRAIANRMIEETGVKRKL